MNVIVELDIFSGRPNPTWELTPDECKDLMNLLDSLPEIDKKANGDDVLGYRGFSLSIDPEIKSNPPYHVHVFQSIVTVDSNSQKVYKDVHGLEEWLLRQASSKGYDAIR